MFNKVCYMLIFALVVANVLAAKAADFYIDTFKEERIEEVRVLPKNQDKVGKKVVVSVSAYSSVEGCDDKDCIMANGKKAEVGYIACSRKYKFGTKMKIQGKMYVCGDRLSRKYDQRVDMFTGYGQEGYKKARAWGIRRLEVEIYE